jgi:hypothetical protein
MFVSVSPGSAFQAVMAVRRSDASASIRLYRSTQSKKQSTGEKKNRLLEYV